ncbi:hypothetical protein LCGC14_0906950 [marine sediment metagenome]|uniref:Uncharacterized protein n=1 Tax=marine sediment metagenome TaxID=412755 RepID=A0A0F9NUS3_9ZZZZ
MKLLTYDPKVSVRKGATEAGSAGGLAILLGIIMQAIRGKNPDLPWTPAQDVVIVGAGVGFLAGIARWFRNRRKHKNL